MSFEIRCGRRRMTYSGHGWRIEIQMVAKRGKDKGALYWMEDRPAYPATLEHGLEMLLKRTLADGESVDVGDLPEAITKALKVLKDSVLQARKLVR